MGVTKEFKLNVMKGWVKMLPHIIINFLKYLKKNDFIIKNPTPKSEELRNIVVEYTK